MSFAPIYHPNKRQLVNQIAKSGVNVLLSQPNKKNYNIVLTGGTSGSDLANYLVRNLNKRRNRYFLKKSELHFWLSDERFVERDSIKKNAKNLYEKELELNLKSDIFDLVILSLSSDGHLASIFSNSKLSDLSSARVEVTQEPLVESPLRLSLSLSQLAQTKMLIILAYLEKPHLRKRKFLTDPSSVVSRLMGLVMINNSQSTILVYTNEEE